MTCAPPPRSDEHHEYGGDGEQPRARSPEQRDDGAPVPACRASQQNERAVPHRRRDRHRDGDAHRADTAHAGENRHNRAEPGKEAAHENGCGAPATVESRDGLELPWFEQPPSGTRQENAAAMPAREPVDPDGRCDIGDPRGQEDQTGARPACPREEGAEQNEGVGGDEWNDVLDRRSGPDGDVDQRRVQRRQNPDDRIDGASCVTLVGGPVPAPGRTVSGFVSRSRRRAPRRSQPRPRPGRSSPCLRWSCPSRTREPERSRSRRPAVRASPARTQRCGAFRTRV